MANTAIMIFEFVNYGMSLDIEVPLNITANELIFGLNKGLNLGIDMNNISDCYLCTEEPRALLRGEQTLEEFGLRDGSVIRFLR